MASNTLTLFTLLLACGGQSVSDDASLLDAGDASPGDGYSDAIIDASSDAPPCAVRPPGLIAWWRAEGNTLDEMNAIPLNSMSVDGGVDFAQGAVGLAFKFSGLGGLEGAAAPLNGLNAISIEGWLHRDGMIGLVISRNMFAGWELFFNAPDQSHPLTSELLFAVGSTEGATASVVGSTQGMYHLAATYATTQGAHIYLNGVEITAKASAMIPIPDEGSVVAIGNRSDGGLGYIGLIDELSIYNTVLSPIDINRIFVAGSSGKCR